MNAKKINKALITTGEIERNEVDNIYSCSR